MAVDSVSQGSASPAQKDPLTSPEESVVNQQEDSILSVSFNQDFGCFACGTEQGFRVYNCETMRETFRRDFPNGGFRVVEILFLSNIMALVGRRYPPSKVMIWDDNQKRYIGEISFRTEVRAVRLRRNWVVVVLDNKIYVYNFVAFKLLNQYAPLPILGDCVQFLTSRTILSSPAPDKGQVRIEHYAKKRTEFINVHASQIASLALNHDGTLLATASTKGTLIRIFNTVDGTKLQELRRGSDRAEIYSLAFSQNTQWLAVSSDKGTIHIFGLNVPKNQEDRRGNDVVQGSTPGSNPGSALSFIRGVLPKYFNSQWSFAQFHLPKSMQYLVAFGHQQNTLIITGLDGSFYRCAFDPNNGGEMEQKEYETFLKPEASNSL